LREGFVATVSHELRTPLALIKGYAETVLHLSPSPEEQRRYVQRIDQLADQLRGLVTGILDVAHLHADPLVIERSPVRLEAIAGRLAADLAVADQAIRLEVDIPSDLPAVEVDPIRIGQVFENLLDNARKYGQTDAPIVLRAGVSEPDWVVVEVIDSGIGVPGADRPLVFEPFHRARNVRESSIPGTGLGLAISRRIVEAHGGRLWLADRADGRPGTCTSFTIPTVRSRRGARGGEQPSRQGSMKERRG
jgi:two-component system phosphate regulon sensor histidine kinase PhoR